MEDKVQAWIKADAAMRAAKAHELELRKELCDHILQGKIKGSKTTQIGQYKLSATAKLNAKIDKDALKSIWFDLTPAEKQSVKFDPKLIAKNYNGLDASCTIHHVITHKPGTPALSVKGA